ncbi:CO(2)-response secreted protease-like [Cornus florida]|uniref:CO(2)-response secreted protease-like n=1 Tax=Cornus florida TaxID=4283 RepID=UPI0028A0DBBC|nr:CO(2)-response secreted protease-like [Cornus florida]
MKSLSISFFCFISLFLHYSFAQSHTDRVYIVYMGAAASSRIDDHAELLGSLLRRKKNSVVHSYKQSFLGFAARLTEEEAHSMAKSSGVVSVFPDPVLQLHTTRSWDFLKYQTSVEIDSGPSPDSVSLSQGKDTIIGIVDTGIWPESASFSDKDMGPIPPQWKGVCMEGKGFTTSNCNRKLIGARYYNDPDSQSLEEHTPRDQIGHGTHVASTAAGSPVSGASYYGLAEGTAKGGSPGSRIAVYRVCSPSGCRGAAILAAFDDAIQDGVDVISVSLGSAGGLEPDFNTDPIAIGSFHAVERGITVVCSAGNEGPDPESVVNVAPWIFTIAATTIDRDFESDVVLGGNKVIKGGGIQFSNIGNSPVYPLINGTSVKAKGNDDEDASHCYPESLDQNQVKGNILVCENDDGMYSDKEKLAGVIEKGGIGLILIDDVARAVSSFYGADPISVITSKDASEIVSYASSTSNPVATILPTVSVTKYKPAPRVIFFSSRGPSYGTKNVLKPDVAAPGVDILAAWLGNDTAGSLPGKQPSLFNVLSGTSMACPHVSGIAATVKSQYPNWSPSAIRSAIMTTAIQTNNLKDPIMTDSGSVATPYDYGAGEVSTSGPLQPGLVYETNNVDYLQFLCNFGYDLATIKAVSKDIPVGFACPNNPSRDLISDMNYPSIAIANFKASKKITRTVTNVGDVAETLYIATVDAPRGLDVKVTPDKLQFTENMKKLSYEVAFSSTAATPTEGDVFGSITWTNEHYKVRSPFVVSSD